MFMQNLIELKKSGQFEQEARLKLEPHSLMPTVQWSLATRILFRFCFAYFILFSLSNWIGPLFFIPKLDIPRLGTLWPLRQITFWTAAHIFRVMQPLVYTSPSHDKTFDWVQTFCLVVFAIVIAATWSGVDRGRQNYVSLHKWFRLFIRFVLASQMLQYGSMKLIPVQMVFPSLTALVEPFGNFSPMRVLWWSIGASPAYEIFAGSTEILGGMLVIFPRTTTLGALVCLADMIQVFTLNMTYDVPVKLYSFHLILFSLFLLAAESRRIISFFFSDRAIRPPAQPPLFRTVHANRIAFILQVTFGLYLAVMQLHGGIKVWYTRGGGRPKPSIYGIWDVAQMTIDGQIRSPLLTDYDRWRRVIFDFTTSTSFQRMDESFANFGSSINDKSKMLTLAKDNDKNWKANFTFALTARDRLVLDGAMDGHRIHMELELADRNQFSLVNRPFHWINEYPFER